LIELLVVIAIVGILAGFIFVSMSGAINSAKDTKIKADMATIEKAVMEYAALNNGAYPALLTDLIPTYLGVIPSNPNGGSYTYTNLTTSFTLSGTLTGGTPWVYNSATNSWGGGFVYGALKQKINIASAGNVAISGPYPVKLTINTQALIPAKLDSSCTALRFSDDPVTTNLSYWIESGCNTSTTIIWVNLPSGVAATTGTDINMFYSPTATTAGSSGSNTFPPPMVFDDFATLDAGVWTNSGGTVGSSLLTLSAVGNNTKTTAKFGVNYSARARINWASYPNFGFDNGAYYTIIYADSGSLGGRDRFQNANGGSFSAVDLGTQYRGYYIYEISRNSTVSSIFRINDGSPSIHATYVPTDAENVRIYQSTSSPAYCDWIIVRPYNAAELASSSANYVGGEAAGQ